ncbi:MAG: response regulator [Anaerolineae bacterium]|nr:response regulator [Anaerolineae bacterium]NIN93967.1 response regulator [Anaerolineae bacterium]NIQ77000.1 response regulator [Anaerolineae bacterium]
MAVARRVLVVDDEEKVVFFLRESLEELGKNFTVRTAKSAEEALEKIDDQPYDLVISDLRMPGIDGLDLLRKIREKNPDTRLILMTAYGSDDVEADARSLDVFDYITKPFHVSDLVQVARDALALPPLSEEEVEVEEELEEEAEGLADDQSAAINHSLSNLRFEIGAQCIVLADAEGRVVSEVGITQGLNMGTFMPLVADGLTTVSSMAEYLQDEETFNLDFYEGRKYDIYSTGVGDNLILALVFDKRKQASRIGMVWLYVKRTIQDLLTTLSGEEPAAPPEEEAQVEEAPPLMADEPSADAEKREIIESAMTKLAEPEEEVETELEAEEDHSTFGIEEALNKGLIDEEFAELLKGED